MSSESEPKPCTYLPGCWVVTAEGWVDHQPTEEAARQSLRAHLGEVHDNLAALSEALIQAGWRPPAKCRLCDDMGYFRGGQHDGEDCWNCNPYAPAIQCPTCVHPEGYDRLSGPCPTCGGDGVLPSKEDGA